MNCHRHSVEEVDLEETSSVHYYNTHLDMFYLIVNETVDCPPSTETTFREKKMEAAVSVFWSYFFASWSTRKVMMSSRSLSHPSPPSSPPDECNVGWSASIPPVFHRPRIYLRQSGVVVV